MTWDYSGLKSHILDIFSKKNRSVVTFNYEDVVKLKSKFNSESKKLDGDVLIQSVAEAIRVAVGTTFRVKADFKNNRIFVIKDGYSTYEKVKVGSREIEILETTDDFIPKYVPPYVDIYGLLKLYEIHFNMETPKPILVVGHKGQGKTLSIAYFAYKNRIPLYQFDCSEDTRRKDLVGSFTFDGEKVMYLLGALPTAINLANRFGSAILVLEELNALSPQMQKVLNSILDWRGQIFVPEINKLYRVDDGCKLMIVATMNPSFYGGTFELNEDLRSRFCEVFIDYPSKENEKKILEEIHEDVDEEIVELVEIFAAETRAGYKRGELSYAISTRDVMMFMELYNEYKKYFDGENALRLAITVSFYNRYSGDEKTTIKNVIQSVFGVSL